MSKKKLEEFDLPYRLAFAIFNILRNFGFDADDIFTGHEPIIANYSTFVEPGTSPKPGLFHRLITQGKTFNILIHIIDKPTEQVLSEWERFLERLALASDQEMLRAIDIPGFNPGTATINIGIALRKQGFKIPGK